MKTLRTNPLQNNDWQTIERIVAAFELAFTQDGYADPLQFVPHPGDPLYLTTVQELLRVDLELAWERGEFKTVEEYRKLFPALFNSPNALSDVVFEEYRLSINTGKRVTPEHYATRYQIDVSSWPEVKLDSLIPSEEENPLTVVVKDISVVTPANIKEDADPSSEKSVAKEPLTYPKIGDDFLGFRIVRELGRGAFARVYLGEQVELANRLVALKVAHQLADESQTLARLQHTNIVPIHSVHQSTRFHAVCMPFFGSTTLSFVLKELRRKTSYSVSGADFVSTINHHRSETIPTETIPEPHPETGSPNPTEHKQSPLLETLKHRSHIEVVLWVGVQLASGLAHAHERGILHRDLKPANILIADDGTPMLLDFNLSVQNTSKSSRNVGGTPFYMAPEQLRSLDSSLGETQTNAVDERSDIYSLGLILYELLTGQVSKTPSDKPLLERVRLLIEERSHSLPSIRQFNSHATPAIEGILAKCLEPLPENRYQKAQHLQEDLERQLDNLPLKYLREPSLRERCRKFVRRNPWARSNLLLASITLVVLLSAGVVIQQVVSQRDNARLEVAEQDFAASYGQLRLSLTSVDRERLKIAVEQAKSSLDKYGLPGAGKTGKPEIVLAPNRSTSLRENLGDLYLLLASAEAQQRSPEAKKNSERWLKLAREWAHKPERKEAVDQFERLLSDPKAKLTLTGDEGLEAILVFAARQQPKELLASLEKRPSHQLKPLHWVVKGNAHTLLGEHSQAVASYTTALALNGEPNSELLVARGVAYLFAKRGELALADFNASLKLLPDHPVILMNRALVYRELGKKEDAIADVSRVIELWPSHTRAYFVRGELYARSGKKDLAKQDFDKGFSTETNDPVSLLARGVAYLEKGQPKEAIQDFDAVLVLEPKSRDARLNKSAALADGLGKLEPAIEVLSEIIDDYPNCTQAIAGRGVYRARLHQRDEAHKDAKLALQTDPSPFIRYQVAGIYALTSSKHPEDAKESLRLLASAFQDRMGLGYIENDADLRGIQKNPQFLKLVEAAKELQRQQETKAQ